MVPAKAVVLLFVSKFFSHGCFLLLSLFEMMILDFNEYLRFGERPAAAFCSLRAGDCSHFMCHSYTDPPERFFSFSTEKIKTKGKNQMKKSFFNSKIEVEDLI